MAPVRGDAARRLRRRAAARRGIRYDSNAGIGTVIATMLPYTTVFLIAATGIKAAVWASHAGAGKKA